ncbi:MAG: heme ABC transporter permease [Alphaproteobacteria bacterium]|nr:heme ABC transporter permease [Alphaproteobacteria bacterium]MDE2012161.1 heme ABC transporter permease [Alphaproteobacteria bacterium]MDE2072174.1 heme ABC transporter permease [Alphaproteobacteria bacterium]
MNIFELANPKRFLALSEKLLPWFWAAAVLTLASGLYLTFFGVPPDYQQGTTVKIMFIHVPAALVGEMAYGVMGVASLLGLVNRHPLADVAAKSAAPLGALFTALALITGSLWGKPMWGTYWVWDARLTSFLILFFLYLGYMALWNAIEDETRAARAAAILALVGVVDLPIIYFSVQWWNTLHQGESIFTGKIAPVFLWPLMLMMAGYVFLFGALWMVRIRTEILARRARALQLQGGGL